MKKLESLKSKKFEDFKNNEIQNASKIIGGVKCLGTGGGTDHYSDATSGNHIGGDGTRYDYYSGGC